MQLEWNILRHNHREARLGTINDGVLFTLTHHPTCYRRGAWRLLIEICGGPNHYKWGCFDDQDQPLRYFHSQMNANSEAQLIANVLIRDRDEYDNQWRCDRNPAGDADKCEVPIRGYSR